LVRDEGPAGEKYSPQRKQRGSSRHFGNLQGLQDRGHVVWTSSKQVQEPSIGKEQARSKHVRLLLLPIHAKVEHASARGTVCGSEVPGYDDVSKFMRQSEPGAEAVASEPVENIRSTLAKPNYDCVHVLLGPRRSFYLSTFL